MEAPQSKVRLEETAANGKALGFICNGMGEIRSDGRSVLVECEDNIHSSKYVSILQEGLIPIISSGQINKDNSPLMEDGAPCHTARATQLWPNQNGITKLPWPSQSPDIDLSLIHI